MCFLCTAIAVPLILQEKMAATGNEEPEISIVTEASYWILDWIAPIVALTGNALFFFWTRRVNDINPFVIPLMGNVILFALYINITVILAYNMKTSHADVNEFLDTGAKTFMPIIILCGFLYFCCPYDDNFVETSTYSSANKTHN